jgi:hypothetical protein
MAGWHVLKATELFLRPRSSLSKEKARAIAAVASAVIDHVAQNWALLRRGRDGRVRVTLRATVDPRNGSATVKIPQARVVIRDSIKFGLA